VLVAGVEKQKQLGLLGRRDERRAASKSPSQVKIGSASMAWIWTGTPSGQIDPNSEMGTQE
jgi:hypothetical protein